LRIVVVSDIHANMEALTAVKDLLDSADAVVCLGDFVGYYTQVNEVIETMREYQPIAVLGNHDQYLLQGIPEHANPAVRFGIEHADRVISAENRAWLAELEETWTGKIDGASWLACHGSPWSIDDYLYEDSPLLPLLEDLERDLVAFGQTHRPLVHADRRPALLNPGSVGQSRHRAAVACAAAVEDGGRTFTSVERDYDPGPVMALARQAGAGDWIGKHLVPADG
jgi:putative phosphoesterase